MQNMNVARHGVTEKLRGHWRLFHTLWSAFAPLALAVHSGGGLVAIEWPLRCTYWHDARVVRLLNKLNCSRAVLAGCMYGLRPKSKKDGEDDDLFLSKSWRVSANDSGLAAALDRRCDHRHRHQVTEAEETAATAHYPVQLARAVHSALARWCTSSGTAST